MTSCRARPLVLVLRFACHEVRLLETKLDGQLTVGSYDIEMSKKIMDVDFKKLQR